MDSISLFGANLPRSSSRSINAEHEHAEPDSWLFIKLLLLLLLISISDFSMGSLPIIQPYFPFRRSEHPGLVPFMLLFLIWGSCHCSNSEPVIKVLFSSWKNKAWCIVLLIVRSPWAKLIPFFTYCSSIPYNVREVYQGHSHCPWYTSWTVPGHCLTGRLMFWS